MFVQVAFLQQILRIYGRIPSSGHTKLGQKAEMFWMETRPTKSEIGKTQKMVEALRKIVGKANKMLRQEAIPDAETDNPVLDKLD